MFEKAQGQMMHRALRERESETARIQRAAEKIGESKKKPGNLGEERNSNEREHTSGVDAWRYVKHVALPLMWPERRRKSEFCFNGGWYITSQCTLHKPREASPSY